jgi:hypothetical protein
MVAPVRCDDFIRDESFHGSTPSVLSHQLLNLRGVELFLGRGMVPSGIDASNDAGVRRFPAK